ncbi:histidine kinase [bacterium]|nr:histidine kinase [bacterium]MCI0607138.1 histidine kinase [bacterium]
MRIRKLLPFLAWLLVGLVFASQLHLFAIRAGGSMGWPQVLIWEIPRWLIWALLAPLVTKIARMYPWRREQATRHIAIHTICGAALSFIHLVLFVIVFHALRLSIGEGGEILDTFQFAFPLDFHVGIAVYWLLVLLRQFSDSEQRVARLQAELTQAQLQALKMQLHPHFLFNTLNSIASFLRTDVEVADEMIGQLGDFLRLTLQNPGTEEIVLEKELEFLKRYLAIEQLRFQDRLHAQFEIDPDTLSALVPNLILQPVVENAVRHGVSTRSGKGTIRIEAKRRDGQLQIVICDNGPGLPSHITEGIGIATTRDRLRRMYGAEAHLDLANQPDGGAVVTLGIPFHVSEGKL